MGHRTTHYVFKSQLVRLCRVGKQDGLTGHGPRTVAAPPSSNRTGGFPAYGFPSSFPSRVERESSNPNLSGVIIPLGPSPRPVQILPLSEQVTSLRSSRFMIPEPLRYYQALRLLSDPVKPHHSSWLVLPVGLSSNQTGLPAFPNATSRHVAHAIPAD